MTNNVHKSLSIVFQRPVRVVRYILQPVPQFLNAPQTESKPVKPMPMDVIVHLINMWIRVASVRQTVVVMVSNQMVMSYENKV